MENKRLYRVEEGKKIAGVCGGFAEFFNIDPTIIRVAWAIISLFVPVGVIAYIVAALVMPVKSEVM